MSSSQKWGMDLLSVHLRKISKYRLTVLDWQKSWMHNIHILKGCPQKCFFLSRLLSKALESFILKTDMYLKESVTHNLLVFCLLLSKINIRSGLRISDFSRDTDFYQLSQGLAQLKTISRCKECCLDFSCSSSLSWRQNLSRTN